MSSDDDFNKGDFNKGGIPTLPPVEKSIENYLEVNCKKYAKQVRQLSQAIEEATSKGDSSVTIHFEGGLSNTQEGKFFTDYLEWLDYEVVVKGSPLYMWDGNFSRDGVKHRLTRGCPDRPGDQRGHYTRSSNIDWQYMRPDSIPLIHFSEESSITVYDSIEIIWGQLTSSKSAATGNLAKVRNVHVINQKNTINKNPNIFY